MTNPISDLWDFLIGNTEDHDALGSWKYLLVALFLALIITSIIVAIRNWREEASQRSGRHLGTWFVRVLVGSMWFQGMLWKLPLPASPGLQYWTEQMGSRAAFAFHRALVADVYLPYLHILGPIIFLADHPPTGGYPVIAVVGRASQTVLARLRAKRVVRFALEESG